MDVEFFVRLIRIVFTNRCFNLNAHLNDNSDDEENKGAPDEKNWWNLRLVRFPIQHLIYAQYQHSIEEEEPNFN